MPDRRQAVVDTSAWIALLGDEADRGEHVERLLQRAATGELRLLVSTVTITEVVKGSAAADPPLSDTQEATFTGFMDNPYVTLVSVDPLVAAKAKDLRKAVPRLKTPDAIQIATALVAGAATLYTYDGRDLLKLDGDPAIGGLRIIVPPVEDTQLDLDLALPEPASPPLALPEPASSANVSATAADDNE